MGYTWIGQKIQKLQKTYTVKRCLSPLLSFLSFLHQRQPLENCFQFLAYPSRDSQCLYQHKCIYLDRDKQKQKDRDRDKHTHGSLLCKLFCILVLLYNNLSGRYFHINLAVQISQDFFSYFLMMHILGYFLPLDITNDSVNVLNDNLILFIGLELYPHPY